MCSIEVKYLSNGFGLKNTVGDFFSFVFCKPCAPSDKFQAFQAECGFLITLQSLSYVRSQVFIFDFWFTT